MRALLRTALSSRPWSSRRSVQVAIVLGVVLAVLRMALPSILRSQIQERASAAVTGRLTLGDVDLWLLFGGLALEDVAFLPEDAAPTDPPLVAFKRLYVQVGYLPFFRHTVRIQDFVLDGLAVHLERRPSGSVPLPGLRAAAPTAGTTRTPTTPAPASPAGAGGPPWNVVVDQAAVHVGHFELHDRMSQPPETIALSLEDLGLRDFALRHDAGGKPGHATIEVKFGDGTVHIDSAITTHEEGFALAATVDIANLPVDRVQLHAPQLGWSGVTGRVDAHLTLTTAQPGALPVTGGRMTVRGLRIDVPGESEPALAWRTLTVDIDEIDIESRHAFVKHVALDGGNVIVTPRGQVPLPLLAGLTSQGVPDAAAGSPESVSEPVAPWNWKVDAVEITDTTATVVLEPPPLTIEITTAMVTGLESTKGSRAQVDLQLREEQGTLGLTGSGGLDPLGATLVAKIDGVELGRLLAATGAAPIELPSGRLEADLKIEAEHGPLLVGGKLGIVDLVARLPQGGEDFAVGWQQLELAIKEVRVPGVLPGTASATSQPIRVDLEQLRLIAPAVTLTRTLDGLVLPASGAAPGAPEPVQSEPREETGPPTSAAGPGLTLALARLDLENGLVSIVDRAVNPLYRGKLSAIAVKATGLRFPERVFGALGLTATLPGGAPFKLDGKQSKGVVSLSVEGKALPLWQFNPYVTQAAGFSISGGTLTLGSEVRIDAEGYDSTTRIDLDRLGVTGAERDTLFVEKVGIPLQLALSLLRDINGRIGLDVPIVGSKSGIRAGLGSIVADALVQAIMGAVMSPLKMLGSVTDVLPGGGGTLAPEPIPCAAGLLSVDPSASDRVQQLSAGMTHAPGLRITLHGAAGGTDVRALQEAAVLADLQTKQGLLGSVRNLANRMERDAIRDALVARASGGSSTLPPEYQKTLDEWTAAKTISDGQLRMLAAARAEAVRAALVEGHGIDAARITVGDPRVDRERGVPSVEIALGR